MQKWSYAAVLVLGGCLTVPEWQSAPVADAAGGQGGEPGPTDARVDADARLSPAVDLGASGGRPGDTGAGGGGADGGAPATGGAPPDAGGPDAASGGVDLDVGNPDAASGGVDLGVVGPDVDDPDVASGGAALDAGGGAEVGVRRGCDELAAVLEPVAGPRELGVLAGDVLERRVVEYLDVRGDTRVVFLSHLREGAGTALHLQVVGGISVRLPDREGGLPVLAAAQGVAYVTWVEGLPDAPMLFSTVVDLESGEVTAATPLGPTFNTAGDVTISADRFGALVTWGGIIDNPDIRTALLNREGTRVLDPVRIDEESLGGSIRLTGGVKGEGEAWVLWSYLGFDGDVVSRRRLDRASGVFGDIEVVVPQTNVNAPVLSVPQGNELLVFHVMGGNTAYWSVVSEDGSFQDGGPITLSDPPGNFERIVGAAAAPVEEGEAPRVALAALSDDDAYIVTGQNVDGVWSFRSHAIVPPPIDALPMPVSELTVLPSQRGAADTEALRLAWYGFQKQPRALRLSCPTDDAVPCSLLRTPDPLAAPRANARRDIAHLSTDAGALFGWSDLSDAGPEAPVGFSLVTLDDQLGARFGGGSTGAFAQVGHLGTSERFLTLGQLGGAPWALFEVTAQRGAALVAAPLNRHGAPGKGTPLVTGLGAGLEALATTDGEALSVVWRAPGGDWRVVSLATADGEPSPFPLLPPPESPRRVRAFEGGIEVLDAGPSGLRVLRYDDEGLQAEPMAVRCDAACGFAGSTIHDVGWDGERYGVMTINDISPDLRRFYLFTPEGPARQVDEGALRGGTPGRLAARAGGGFLVPFLDGDQVAVLPLDRTAAVAPRIPLEGVRTLPSLQSDPTGLVAVELETGESLPRARRFGCR